MKGGNEEGRKKEEGREVEEGKGGRGREERKEG